MKTKNTPVLATIVTPALTETQLLEISATQFISTSANVVGIAATTQLFDYLTGLMVDQPAFARKLATPAIQDELSKVAASLKGKELGMSDLMMKLPGLIGSLNRIFGK